MTAAVWALLPAAGLAFLLGSLVFPMFNVSTGVGGVYVAAALRRPVRLPPPAGVRRLAGGRRAADAGLRHVAGAGGGGGAGPLSRPADGRLDRRRAHRSTWRSPATAARRSPASGPRALAQRLASAGGPAGCRRPPGCVPARPGDAGADGGVGRPGRRRASGRRPAIGVAAPVGVGRRFRRPVCGLGSWCRPPLGRRGRSRACWPVSPWRPWW